MSDIAITTNTRPDRAAVASQWQLIWWAFKRHRLAMAALFVTIAMYIVALLPGFFAINDPVLQNARATFHPPQRVHFIDTTDGLSLGLHYYPLKLTRDPETLAAVFVEDTAKKIPIQLFGRGYEYSVLGLFTTDIHLLASTDKTRPLFLFGADRLGRDVFSRVIQGSQISLSIGLVGVFFSLLLGVVLGGISGYYGGRIDFVMQRVIDFVLSLPTIPIWLALAAALPQGWPATLQYMMITIILSLTGWAQLARVVRGRFLSLRTEEFVAAARLDGVPEGRIIFRHMLPSFSSHIIASVTLAVPAMILAETSLSFLGLGLQPPTISWGVLLREAQNIRSIATAPWLFLPGVAVVVAVMALNLLGDGLRDAADPYNK
ncbi:MULTISPECIES: ABC transporter permease [Rhizobium/Agrobacterium group]|jgi:peptide/nickel transport system permease protein|uniref:ABC transporter permease n=2 Tax=Rhizobium/Agrobacterium group TaxID=227290 RepID=A0A1B9T7I6_AGRTU|nr:MULTISPECIES: ABC transporter permease [Rhizobium/Agrobacterium group]MDP9563713.1 peptide/nickel transport system permease protein [Rhizobium nepotum]QDG94106.1 ABC transporter permease [Rhizobium sp. NIBRBAC000502774]AYM14451.1 peptide/nickel transport system permease protein [Agrobacterium tumefaciens]MBO9112235.1 ABC transporter permease [Agrobacterium sp. S2/73]MDH7808678.1 peptide/nickel transport system permease protein [Rhizobium sp. AN67]